jgi:hypothetical protein
MKKIYSLFLSLLVLFVINSLNVNAQTYCDPSYNQNSTWEYITNVTFSNINNSTGASSSGYANYTSTVAAANITIGTPYTVSVSIQPDANEYIYVFIDWNQNGTLDNAGEVYLIASNVGGYGPYTYSITPPATALTGTTRMRVMVDWADWNVGDPCAYWSGYGEIEDYAVNVQSPVTITNVVVSTQGNVTPAITTNGGTLQMTATVLPSNASQNVTWSIINVTGLATISASGLITAQGNGTVWAKATSVADNTKKDSMLVTLSNQIVPITSLTVTTQSGVPATINTPQGTLQLVSTILPSYANQNVNWTITPVTGDATINSSGLVTGISDGTVWAKATSVEDPSKKDSLLIILSNQTPPPTGIIVRTVGNVPATITTNGGTLDLEAEIIPSFAQQDVIWSITPVTGLANIASNGVVYALDNGTVWAKATSVRDANIKDSILVTISGQFIVINSLKVNTVGNVPALIHGNTPLKMVATITPFNADREVNWSIVPVSGNATISSNGVVTPTSNGIIYAKAVSVTQPNMMDSMRIVITNYYTDIASIEENNIEVYPNPIINEINIVINDITNDKTSVNIYNTLGQLIISENIKSNHKKINTSNLSNGVYIIELKNDNKIIGIKKVTK